MRTVCSSSWPMAQARLKAIVVLPTPPFGANTLMIRDEPTVEASTYDLRTSLIRATRS